MGAEEPRSRLGRGLAALIGDMGDDGAAVDRARGQRRVPTEALRPNPRNPRRHFAEAELENLAASVRERGVLAPILVRAVPPGPGESGRGEAYEIIAGERRWRASSRAGLRDVPVVVIEASDRESLEYAVIENVQRADLNALEEAAGYERLIADFNYSQTDLATVIGKSRSHVANTLRLLKLPEGVKAAVLEGALTAGHARALLAVQDPEGLARRVVGEGLTVRDVERIGQGEAEAAAVEASLPPRAPRRSKDAETRTLEQALENVLGLGVRVDHKGEGGELRIKYRSVEQLDAFCRRFNVKQ